MSEQFKVGEIAILQNLVGNSAIYNGVEVEILGPLALVKLAAGDAMAYRISLPHPNPCADYHAQHIHLRRRKPPTVYTGEIRIRELFDLVPDGVAA